MACMPRTKPVKIVPELLAVADRQEIPEAFRFELLASPLGVCPRSPEAGQVFLFLFGAQATRVFSDFCSP